MSTEERVCHLDKDYYRLVDHVSKLPHKILQHHHLESLPQIILHELGNENGFGLKKAVYLVDNPDFDHLIGAAGFCCKDCPAPVPDALDVSDESEGLPTGSLTAKPRQMSAGTWQYPEELLDGIKGNCFNNEVKKIVFESLRRKKIDFHDSDYIKDLGVAMGFEDPQVISWDMKHGNHGILIFEHEKELSDEKFNLLRNAVALLSLCGV